jgi:hypothetical protein
MKTIKRKYMSPKVVKVTLDQEISMVLNSLPPDGPGESLRVQAPEFFSHQTLKS